MKFNLKSYGEFRNRDQQTANQASELAKCVPPIVREKADKHDGAGRRESERTIDRMGGDGGCQREHSDGGSDRTAVRIDKERQPYPHHRERH